METIVESALDVGNDVLVIEGTVDGKKVTAKGWVSAMTNYYTPDSYDPTTGVRAPNAQPRDMTLDEKTAYCATLLEAAVPAAQPEPTNMLFQGGEK